MQIISKNIQSTVLVLSLALFSGTSLAQVESIERMPQDKSYSEEQIESFLAISKRINDMQMQMMKKVEAMAMEKGLDMDTFKEMQMAMRQGGEAEMANYTEEQRQAFMSIMQAAQSKQQSMMTKVQEIAQEEGMDMQTYQQMAMQAQTDDKLRERIQAEVAEDEAE